MNLNDPGKYDDLCTGARLVAKAEGVILIVINGEKGSGFSVQGTIEVLHQLPEVLEAVAEQIRASMNGEMNG
jgi:hypothetical protein